MTKQGLKVALWACLAGALLAVVFGGGRSITRSYLFEFSEQVTAAHLLEWAFLGGALALLFCPVAVPASFPSPQPLQVFAGACFGLTLALMSYGGVLSIVVGASLGAVAGFLAPFWTPRLR